MEAMEKFMEKHAEVIAASELAGITLVKISDSSHVTHECPSNLGAGPKIF